MQHRFRIRSEPYCLHLGSGDRQFRAHRHPAVNAAERKRATVKKVAPSATASTKKTADRRVAVTLRSSLIARPTTAGGRECEGKPGLAPSRLRLFRVPRGAPAKLSFGQMAGLHGGV